ncbi:MAG: hypothetical protein CMH53_10845, partial [Myxococcales bacterium]|nr:hypothetical protein [Myxococcales bacterium]
MAPEQWQAIPRDQDPFVVEFPDAVTECLSDGVDTSEGLLDVDTGTCGFVTAQNVLIDEIRASEQVRLTFWHLALTAPEPAEGRLVLRVGNDTLF